MEEAPNPNPPLPPVPLSKWRKVPNLLIVVGLALAALGAAVDLRQFGYSYLLAFMFYLSLGLGALFLVLMHHLFDAGWSVPIRRFCEHIACLLFPWMAVLFIPILLLARKIYPWMTGNPQTGPAWHSKWPQFARPMFYAVAALCFGVWWLLSSRLRHWSLKQDETGAAKCTYRMRFHSGWGVFAFAVTLTLAAIMWMKALQREWFSTMYGVYYFSGSVWVTLGTVYVITVILDRQRILAGYLRGRQYYFLGSLFFAFTVFYAYIHFSQYFIIWNANVPEETFWYVLREKGSWYYAGLVIIFGHFFLPFLAMLRIDAKSTFSVMVPLGIWGWLMHYADLAFNIMPVIHPDGFAWQWLWLDLACLALMGGILTKVFLRNFNRHSPYPAKDPRLMEAAGCSHFVPAQISGGGPDETAKPFSPQHPTKGGAR